MKVRITDIPPEGRELSYDLDLAGLNERLVTGTGVSDDSQRGGGIISKCAFVAPPKTSIKLNLEGSTVILKGEVAGKYLTSCSRCAEEMTKDLKREFRYILKPHSDRSRPDEEVDDLELGFYDGREVDPDPFIEEALVLAMPFSEVCSPECKGLCPRCGCNLNSSSCECSQSSSGDERFSILRGLKIQ